MRANRIRIEMEVNGNTGSGEIAFIENDGWNAPHYSVFIDVPYQNSRWSYLGGKNLSKEEVMRKAKEELEGALLRCTMF